MQRNRVHLQLCTAILLLLTGCKSLFEAPQDSLASLLENSPDAATVIEEEIREREIIFIPEEHTVINPILFLKENIKAFYGAGVRYLFLEGGFPPLPGSENYRFPIFYPWSLVGWKYEVVELAEAINELNSSLPERDKLQVVLAEAGNTVPTTFEASQAPMLINERDHYAYKRIQGFLENAEKGAKAIVFYGGAHGSKETSIQENRGGGVLPFDWKPLGVYLEERYKDRYLATDYKYAIQFSPKQATMERPFLVDKQKYVPSKALARCSTYQWENKYEAVILEKEPKYGLGYQFVPNDENLRVIFNSLRRIDRSFKEVVRKSQNMRFQPLGQYLAGIYYLKLYFGEHFDYSLWNPQEKLSIALDRLEEYAFSPDKSPSKLVVTQKHSSEAFYDYCRLMYLSGIDRYIGDEGSRGVPSSQITESLQEAIQVFPNDLWAVYWLAYIHTVGGEFKKALTECELIMSNPLGGCMETLPRVYQMASRCALELGQKEISDHYRRIAHDLRNEYDIEVDGLLDLL